jgi:hypothetical protein
MISKDNKKQLNIFDIPDSFIPEDMRVYYPDWDNEPPPDQGIVKRNGTPLLSKGGILTLCAEPGAGKSSIMEAWISSVLNSESDSLGVQISLNSSRNKILFCDTERSIWESHKAWKKLMKRANVTNSSKIAKSLIFANLKALNSEERKKYVSDFAKENKDIGIIVLDGMADFLNNTNDLDESNKLNDWINTFNPNICFMQTIHTNPNDNKPRGHAGTIACHRSQTVILAKKCGDGFELTTNFEYGKNRHGKHENWYYKYCQETDMFVSSESIPKQPKTTVSNTRYKELAQEIWKNKPFLTYIEILNTIGEKLQKTKLQSKNIFIDQFKGKICQRVEIDSKPFWELLK